jgi:hypothetical protein
MGFLGGEEMKERVGLLKRVERSTSAIVVTFVALKWV